MKLTALATFLFISLAAAAHISNHFHEGCRGGFLGYPHIAPRSCARAIKKKPHLHGARSVQFSHMPKHARLFGYQGMPDNPICGVVNKRANTGGKHHHCMGPLAGGGQYAGSSWAHAAGKRNGDVSADESCIDTVAPEELVLDDGHMYNLTAMSDDMVEKLYELALNGTRKVTLSTQFSEFEVDEAGVQERLQEM